VATSASTKPKSYFDDDDDMDVPINAATKALRDLPYRDLINYHTTLLQFDAGDDFSPAARKIIAQLMRFRVTVYSVIVLMQLTSMEIHRDRNAKRGKVDVGQVNAHLPMPTGDASLVAAADAATSASGRANGRTRNTFTDSINQELIDKFEAEWMLDFISLTDASHMLAWGRNNFDKALRENMDTVYKLIETTFELQGKVIRSAMVVNKKRPWLTTPIAGKIARSDLTFNLETNDSAAAAAAAPGKNANQYLPFWVDFAQEEVDAFPDGNTVTRIAGMSFPMQFQNTNRLNDGDMARCARSIGITLQYMMVVTESPCVLVFMVRRLVCRSTGESKMFINMAAVYREAPVIKYIERIALERFFDPYFKALWDNASQPSFEDEETIAIDPIAANSMIDPKTFRSKQLNLDSIMQHAQRANTSDGHVARYTDEQLQAFLDPESDVSDCVSWTNIQHNARDIARTLQSAGLSVSVLRDVDASSLVSKKRKAVDPELVQTTTAAPATDKNDEKEPKRARVDNEPCPMEIDHDDDATAQVASAPVRTTAAAITAAATRPGATVSAAAAAPPRSAMAGSAVVRPAGPATVRPGSSTTVRPGTVATTARPAPTSSAGSVAVAVRPGTPGSAIARPVGPTAGRPGPPTAARPGPTVAAAASKPAAATAPKPVSVATAASKPVADAAPKPVAATSSKPAAAVAAPKPVAAASSKPAAAAASKPVVAAATARHGPVATAPKTAMAARPATVAK